MIYFFDTDTKQRGVDCHSIPIIQGIISNQLETRARKGRIL